MDNFEYRWIVNTHSGTHQSHTHTTSHAHTKHTQTVAHTHTHLHKPNTHTHAWMFAHKYNKLMYCPENGIS